MGPPVRGPFCVAMYRLSDEFTVIGEDVIRTERSLQWIPRADIRIGFMESDKEKKKSGKEVLGDCRLVKEPWNAFCPFDFLITIYLPNVAGMSMDQIRILLLHELLHVGMDEKNGEPVYRIVPHDIEEFREIINRYGIDWAR